jgi:DNA polymerase IV
MPSQRIIAHFDLDSFFVSVECLLDPGLKGKPVLVGGGERGVVAACSYEARKFGIHSAMPMKTARRLCPQAIVVGGTRGEYSKYSRIVTEIIAAKAPVFEKASIDEFYLDLTGMDKFFNPFQWTVALREEIISKTGLPISFGLGSNKMIAKMATKEAKPNGYLHVPAGMEIDFLTPLSVDKIPGVGEQTHKLLISLNIKYIGDVRKIPESLLQEKLGNFGTELWKKAHGIHGGEVINYHEAKSISSENTFAENLTDEKEMIAELLRLTEKISYELRQDQKVAGVVTVKIRYPDFETTSRQTTIQYTSADDEFFPVVKDLFRKLYRRGQPVRLLGVRLSELTNVAVQANLFSNAAKKSGLYKAIDEVKNRFGKTSVKRASSKK